jgi:hypothetical protein
VIDSYSWTYLFSDKGKKECPFLMGEIAENRMYTFSNMVGVSANTGSAYPAIFNGACVFPDGKDRDTTFISLPTLAKVTEALGYKTQTISS